MLEAENLKSFKKIDHGRGFGDDALFFIDGNFKSPADNVHGTDLP